jgi:transposase
MPVVMRYPDSGGLSARGRVLREKVRLQAAAMFEQKMRPEQIAARLRVSTKSVYQWRRRWKTDGVAGLVSRGPGGATCRLSDQQLARLKTELGRGPAAHGWVEDQRWTLARVAIVIRRLYGVDYTLRGVSYLLHRIGWTPQMPKQRAMERDEDAIAAWRTTTWAKVRG